MKYHIKKIHHLQQYGKQLAQNKRVVTGIVLFAAIAAVLLLRVHAITSFISLEPENGTIAGNATAATDTTASNGKALAFGKAPTSSGKFYVVGKDIIDPDGNIFYPIGSNVALKLFSYNYVFEGGNGGANQHIQELKDWHWNTVRANLICDNDSGVPSMDELMAGLQTEVPKITSQKIVVMLSCSDSTGGNMPWGAPKDLKVQQFWQRAAVMFKDNPYVWFNIYDEPWNGAPDSNYTTLYANHINAIRATGAQNIIVTDAPVFGQGVEYFGETNLGTQIAGGKCNVVLSWHAYGAFHGGQGSTADFQNAIRQVHAKNLAILVGEVGIALPPENGNAGPWEWNVSGFNAVMQIGQPENLGVLWWHATGDSSDYLLYSLKNDHTGYWDGGAGAKLTGPGQTFWDFSHAAPFSLGKFTGNLANSNCPGA